MKYSKPCCVWVLGAILLQRREASKTSFMLATQVFKARFVLTCVGKALWAYLWISHIRCLSIERKCMVAVGRHNLQDNKQYRIMQAETTRQKRPQKEVWRGTLGIHEKPALHKCPDSKHHQHHLRKPRRLGKPNSGWMDNSSSVNTKEPTILTMQLWTSKGTSLGLRDWTYKNIKTTGKQLGRRVGFGFPQHAQLENMVPIGCRLYSPTQRPHLSEYAIQTDATSWVSNPIVTYLIVS